MQHLWLTGMARVVSNVKIVTLQCLPKKTLLKEPALRVTAVIRKLLKKPKSLMSILTIVIREKSIAHVVIRDTKSPYCSAMAVMNFQ